MQVSDSANATPSKSVGYWQLVALGEPYRLLFPIGALLGIVGVLLWPLFVWKLSTAYPAVAHARIMIEGFFTAFVFGFLGTALPRLLGAPKITLGESLAFAILLLGVVASHLAGAHFWGDTLFFFTLLGFVSVLGIRFCFRKDTPPPGFLLVLLGLMGALLGSLSMVISSVAPSALAMWLVSVGKILLYQGYILLPVMGIGAFLLPRFFALPNKHDFPESLALPSGWVRRASWCLAIGLLVIVSFFLEAYGHLRPAYLLRALAMIAYFYTELPMHKAAITRSTLSWGLRIALLSPIVGYLLVVVWPAYRLGILHVAYITGFALLTLTVATRVVLGHSGQSHRFKEWSWLFFSIIALIIVAMLTRVTADWMPTIQMSHYAYAALIWITATILWLHMCRKPLAQSDD